MFIADAGAVGGEWNCGVAGDEVRVLIQCCSFCCKERCTVQCSEHASSAAQQDMPFCVLDEQL
jgi:hypothetical protein